MLPKLEEKSQVRDSGPYRAFAMDFLGPSQCDNNISKLKRLREFLDDESIENHKKQSRQAPIPKFSTKEKRKHEKKPVDKENETKEYRTRKANTADKQNHENQTVLSARIGIGGDQSVFALPDKFRVSELMKAGSNRFRLQRAKDLFNSSLRMNDKLSSNKIL